MITVNHEFLISCLGPCENQSMTGIDLKDVILGHDSKRNVLGHNPERILLGHGAIMEFLYKNWNTDASSNYRLYPDILVQFGTYVHMTGNRLMYQGMGSTVCSNIGKDETLDQAKERVKKWFYEDVVPLYLEILFS